MRLSRWKLLIIVVLAAHSLVACSGAGFPRGTYVAETSGAQLEFREDGTFVYTDEGVLWATGSYSIAGDELTWETDSSCDGEGIERATYSWTYENGELILEQKGEDLCAGRIRSIDNLVWRLEE